MSGRASFAFVSALALGGALLLASPLAFAQDRKAETAAREALQGAQADFATGAHEKAITRLRRASRACSRCGPATRAQLLRDTGAIQFQSGDEEGGAQAFVEALKLEPNAELSQRYDTAEVRAAWEAAKDEAQAALTPQPSGDFVHTPAADTAVRTPLPVYVEVDAAVTKVQVRYKGTGAKEYGRVDLSRVGKGWGGYVPCEAVKLGVVRYYVVGVDSTGSPAATSGDPKRPFHVSVRSTISGASPSLPGSAPPKQCAAGQAPAPVGGGDEKPGPTPGNGGDETPEANLPTLAPGKFPRLWVGIAGSLDLASRPSGNNVCKLSGDGRPANDAGYFCTDPNGGADFPLDKAASDQLVNGKAGSPSGGLGAGDARAMLTVDYAVSTSLLIGGRLGYVANGYPGKLASANGKGFGPSLHIEARATYLFGTDALIKTGFSPLVMGGAGVAEYDMSQVVQVARTGVAGQQAILAWRTGGPGFVTVGGGVRYAFSPRIGFTSLLKLTAAFGGSGLIPYAAPEVGLAYGF